MSGELFVPATVAAELDLLRLSREGPIHFVGICGAGMSALAEYVVRAGGQATGCDAKPAGVTPALRALGVEVAQGHAPEHVAAASAVVATSAVAPAHPELKAARARGIPVLKRGAALGALVNAGRVIGVAGTHGKTTTTGMLATTLVEAGLDPTAFVGGRMPGWQGGLRAGGRLYVVEADEYDRSFLALRPEMAVVTTIEADHMEIYGDLASLDDAFVEFLEPVPADGLIAVCTDDAGAARLAARLPQDRLVTYGLGDAAALRATRVNVSEDGTRFHVVREGQTLGEFRLAVPGRHNVRNALATLAVALHAGADIAAVRRGFEAFGGVDRRFQRLGEKRAIVVIDDYAHHPTEVEATVSAARERFASRRLVVVFQPHLYSRTRDLWREFGSALAEADAVWVTDVFPAREDPIDGVTGELVANAAREAGAKVRYHPAVEGIEDTLAGWLESGDVCVLMSAGDLSEHAHALIQQLEEDEDR
ncbi:MAG TPA: UDP-N-acetylmuramate--L-alanine ligase [Longimicrobiales bacterium]|nr:UDP-N-acetylmuramate--L-alanine ligase [Longimicrobiales bacterium]